MHLLDPILMRAKHVHTFLVVLLNVIHWHACVPASTGSRRRPACLPIAHCSACDVSAGFGISVPGFNTTLSRVDRLEVAAVSEVLLALMGRPPRNCSAASQSALLFDLALIARRFPQERALPTTGAGLQLPDMLPIYCIVITRFASLATRCTTLCFLCTSCCVKMFTVSQTK